MPPEPIEHVDQVRGESHAHRHVADGVLQDEVPADDPGDQFAHGGVGVGVGAAGDGDHRSQLGVTQPGEGADDGDQHQRKRQRRPSAGPPQRGGVVNDEVGQRSVEDGRGVELLPGDSSADDREDSRTDDGTDAQRRQRPRAECLFQPVFRLFASQRSTYRWTCRRKFVSPGRCSQECRNRCLRIETESQGSGQAHYDCDAYSFL